MAKMYNVYKRDSDDIYHFVSIALVVLTVSVVTIPPVVTSGMIGPSVESVVILAIMGDKYYQSF